MRSHFIDQSNIYRGNGAVAEGGRTAAKVCEFSESTAHRLITADLDVCWGGNEKRGFHPRCRSSWASHFVIILSPSFAGTG
jgi:hypothetical protein